MDLRNHKKKTLLLRLLTWRIRHLSNRNFMFILSVMVGLSVGLAAVLVKNSVHWIRTLLTSGFSADYFNYWFFVYPAIGIGVVVVLLNLLLKIHVGQGVPMILHAISTTRGVVKRHHLFSSVLTSTLTVGFGGSVGLEGPMVATGGSIGSNLGQLMHLSYRQIILLIGCAAAGAMSAIFKSPIAAIVFTLEVIMLDLTMSSLIPLLLSSVSAALTSYLFLGTDVLYKVETIVPFEINQVPMFIGLGVFCGFISVWFTRVMVWTGNWFDRFRANWIRWLVGGSILGLLIFLFPSLYGEGYESINMGLNQDLTFLFEKSPFFSLQGNTMALFALLAMLLLVKSFATGVTFGAGGIGGVFAPALFTGMVAGLLFANAYNQLFNQEVSITNFALVGMGGIIAGVLHAPLTAIFLIAEITMATSLFMPLMITATISYATIRLDATLGDLVNVVSQSSRNISPVVDDHQQFYGMVILDDIRHIMFRHEQYDTTFVRNIMVKPKWTIDPDENVEEVARKFHQSGKYNIPVIRGKTYVGFISRARLFSSYRQLLKQWSED